MGLQIQGQQLTRAASGKSRKPRAKDKSLRSRRYKRTTAVLPYRWDFIPSTGEWLPQIAEIPVVPGVGGVRSVREGMDPSPLPIRDSIERKKGGIVLNEADPRVAPWFAQQGVAAELYQMDEDDAGRPFYFSIFESYRVIGQGIEWESEDDLAVSFRRHLRDCGAIPEMDPAAKRRIIDRREAEHDQFVNMHGASPANAALSERVRLSAATLWAMQEEKPVADWPEWTDDERKRLGYASSEQKPKRARK